jgi:uncharacterized damage-inducible protein DinB
MDLEQLLDAWRASNEINLELLERCSESDFDLKPGKGKTIRSNFVHLIGVRRTWVDVRLPKEAGAIAKLDFKTATREELKENLAISSKCMESVFRKMAEAAKPGKWHLLKFFAYCIAHEAHHRSQIEIAWRLNGSGPDDAFLYDIWEWSKRPRAAS